MDNLEERAMAVLIERGVATGASDPSDTITLRAAAKAMIAFADFRLDEAAEVAEEAADARRRELEDWGYDTETPDEQSAMGDKISVDIRALKSSDQMR